MSSSSDLSPTCSEGLDVAVLKSWDFNAWRNTYGWAQLPYRMDRLQQRGIRLHWTDKLHVPTWSASRSAAAVRKIETLGVPFFQTLLLSRQIRRSDATIGLFESEANFLAAMRNFVPESRRAPFLVLSCWLANLLIESGRARRAGYRSAYRSVDVLYCFSRNQTSILQEMLHLGPERIRYLPFGVDAETFSPTGGAEGDYVLAVGRDRGRDWPTFFRAVEGIDAPVKVLCRPSQLAGLEVPANVEVLGHVDREVYRQLLREAAVVAVITRPVQYPSGQSVLLEAMAMARTVVVSRTPSLEEYIKDGIDCLGVPPSDPSTTRARIEEALADPTLRASIGASARQTVESSFSSVRMWDAVADDIYRLTGRST